MQVQPENLVLVEGIIEACDNSIRNKDFIWPGNQRKSFFHTCVSCQLQEVSGWLGTRKPVAACETSILFKTLTESNCVRPESGECRLVRAVLVFRAVLMAMILGMALDNSSLCMTDASFQIVLLK